MTVPSPLTNLMRSSLLALWLFILLLRVPFLYSPIQEDDIYYLAGGQHALVEPLHPHHVQYVFQGDVVDMRGHPHPPLNAWILGALLKINGGVREARFHAAYLLLYLLAGTAAYFIARRFTTRPLIAAMLFAATPALMVQSNSLESDLPFIAFWLSGVALFLSAVDRRSINLLAASALILAIASLGAFQSIVSTPILGFYLWQRRRDWTPAWAVIFTAPIVLVSWQLFERFTGGRLPAQVLTGYFTTYALQKIANKVSNALALTGHLAWVVFPVLALMVFRPQRRSLWILAGIASLIGILLDPNPLFWASFATGILILAECVQRLRTADPATRFLSAWIVIFFATALVIFFAGAARYLLPVALPLAILVTRPLAERRQLLYAGVALQAAFSLMLAASSYEQWASYRRFSQQMQDKVEGRRVWVNGEWGLRYYFERLGAKALQRDTIVRPGDLLITSELGYPLKVTTAGGELTPIATQEVRSTLPFRLLSLHSKSAFSTITFGLRPFDLSTQPIDVIRAEAVTGRQPTLSYLPMNAPEAERQIQSGLFGLEGNRWRWSGRDASVLLLTPSEPQPVEAQFNIPDVAKARHITLLLNGKTVAEATYPSPGNYTLRSAPLKPSQSTAEIVLHVDEVTTTPNDPRELGVIVTAIGFAK